MKATKTKVPKTILRFLEEHKKSMYALNTQYDTHYWYRNFKNGTWDGGFCSLPFHVKGKPGSRKAHTALAAALSIGALPLERQPFRLFAISH